MGPDPAVTGDGADVAELVTMGETMALLSHPHTTPLRHAQSLGLGVGGSESNVAIAAARLGITTAWIGRVGSDELGEMVLRELRAEGIRTLSRVDPSRPTGMMLKARRTSQSVHVTYYRSDSAGSALDPSDVNPDVLKRASVFHTSAITPAISASAADAVHKSIEVCRASSTLVSIDLNFRRALWSEADARQEFRRLAASADIVFATEAEARIACGGAGVPDLAQELAGLGRGRAIVKLGERGAVASIDGELFTVAPVPVLVVDPVGAGDAFAAGYLAATIHRLDTQTALQWAALMGAWSVATHGDWQGLPSRAELSTLQDGADDVRR
jgi:2-dehydro-3-deoxygluconokinase